MRLEYVICIGLFFYILLYIDDSAMPNNLRMVSVYYALIWCTVIKQILYIVTYLYFTMEYEDVKTVQ